MRYILIAFAVFCGFLQLNAQNNIVYGAGISYTNGAPSFTPPARTARVAIDTVTGKWYHFNTPGGWQLLGNTVEEIAGCSAPAYTPTKGDSKLVINACTNPEVYFWNGSAWVWINEGTTYYAGDGIRIEGDTIILDSLYTLRFRTGSALDGDAGLIQWNAQELTLDVGINAGNVTGQMFEDVFYNCRNQTGSTITRGTVVMAAGTLGASGRILITPAIADGSVNSEYILGTAAMDIANGSDGLVFHFGKDRGLNTTGSSCGETWADGDVLYCSASTAGCLTKVVPTAPNLKVPVAIVINAANNGTLFIRPSHFPDLAQINDVQLTSPTTGQTLIYNSVSGVWSNQTPADPSSTNELQTLSTGTNTLTLSNGGGTVTVDTDPANDVTGSGTNGQVSFWTGAQTQASDADFTWDSDNNRFGVGASTGDYKMNVVSTTTDNFARFNDGTIDRSIIYKAGRQEWRLSNGVADVGMIQFSTPAGSPGIQLFTGSTFNQNRFDIVNAGAVFRIGYNALAEASRLHVHTNGAVSIGVNSDVARFRVSGAGSTSSTWTAQFHNSAGNNNALMIRDDGRTLFGAALFNDLSSQVEFNGRVSQSSLGLSTYFGVRTGASDDLTNNQGTGFGYEVGRASTTGTGWAGFGYRAAYNAIEANNYIAFGFSAGFSAINNSNWTAIGYAAGYFNSTGVDWTAIGFNSSFSNTSGNSFVSIGRSACNSVVSGSNYVAIGSEAGRYINAGSANTSTDNSIYIGFDTRSLAIAQTNETVIGYQGRGLGSNTTRIGNSSTTQTHLDGSLTLGDTVLDPSAALDISSTTRGVLFPRMTTTQRNLITTPADGLVIYNTTDNKLQVRAAGTWVDLH